VELLAIVPAGCIGGIISYCSKWLYWWSI